MAPPSSDALMIGLDSAHSLWYMVDIVVLFVSQEIFRWFAFKSCADLAGAGGCWIDSSSLWDFSEAESDTELC